MPVCDKNIGSSFSVPTHLFDTAPIPAFDGLMEKYVSVSPVVESTVFVVSDARKIVFTPVSFVMTAK